MRWSLSFRSILPHDPSEILGEIPGSLADIVEQAHQWSARFEAVLLDVFGVEAKLNELRTDGGKTNQMALRFCAIPRSRPTALFPGNTPGYAGFSADAE
jgi:hypothetical protein